MPEPNGSSPAPPVPPPPAVARPSRDTPRPAVPPPSTALPGPALALRGLAVGVVAAVIGGLLWYGIVASIHRQFFYLALLIGVLVGAAVSLGAGRRGDMTTYVTAVVLALMSIVVATYFIDRYFLIRFLHDNDVQGNLKLWNSFDFAKRLMLDSTVGGTRLFHGAVRIKGDPIRILFWLLALAGAGYGVHAVAESGHSRGR